MTLAGAQRQPPHTAQWRALLKRDPAADGRFVYAVSTTGVYCRPSCPARAPRRENVCVFASPTLAELAGFRACKRCRPERAVGRREAQIVLRVCRLLEQSSSPPTLRKLADDVGLSPSTLGRLFKTATGLTPKRYFLARRAEALRTALQTGASVTSALYGAGYNSSSRLYEESYRRLGMTPKARRAGGAGQTLRYVVTRCSLGKLLVATTTRGVAAVWLGTSAQTLTAELERTFPHAELTRVDRRGQRWVEQVVVAVEHPADTFPLPLDVRGTAFQERVWRALAQIPAGQTRSYAQLARSLGVAGGARAVGNACAANPAAVAIPCHRAVGKDGKLHGYRWGVQRKRTLLQREAEAFGT